MAVLAALFAVAFAFDVELYTAADTPTVGTGISGKSLRLAIDLACDTGCSLIAGVLAYNPFAASVAEYLSAAILVGVLLNMALSTFVLVVAGSIAQVPIDSCRN